MLKLEAGKNVGKTFPHQSTDLWLFNVIHQESCKTNDEITTKKVEDGERVNPRNSMRPTGFFNNPRFMKKLEVGEII